MKELIGHIGVDSGQVMVGDPCYLRDWKAVDFHPGALDVIPEGEFSYRGACKATLGIQGAGVLNNGLAIACSTDYGDGEYPVYVERNSRGNIVKLIVDFDKRIGHAAHGRTNFTKGGRYG